MRIIVAGVGKYGSSIAGDLVAEGHDVTVIDIDAMRIDSLMEEFDLSGVVGNVASYVTQLEASVDDCDAFLAMTSIDEVNLIAAILAKNLGAKRTFARVIDPDYSPEVPFIKKSFNIDYLINPNLLAAQEIVRMLRYPSATRVDSFVRGQVHVVELRVPQDSILADLKLLNFKQVCGEELMVCAIERGSDVIIPDGSSVIKAGDTIHVTGEVNTLHSFYQKTNTVAPTIRNILIIGGGSIVYWLLSLMNKKRFSVKLIEWNKEVAELIHKDYPWVDIIQADGTDQKVLEECNIENYDAFLSLTGIDEENVLASLFATHSGVSKTITKIKRTRLLEILNDTDLQNVLTPQHIVADDVVRIIRAMENSQGSAVEALYRFADGKVEALEFVAAPHSKVVGHTLQDLNLRESLRIACIERDQDIIFPAGQDRIYAGDRVIVVSSVKKLNDLDDILGG